MQVSTKLIQPHLRIVLIFAMLLCFNHQIVNSHLSSTNITLESIATLTASKLDEFFSNYRFNNEDKLDLEIDQLGRYLIEYHNWYVMWSIKNLDEFLTNPVNEYLLVKRMGDLRRELDLMAEHHINNTINFSLLLDENFRKLLPTLSEMEDAALGLIRLQTTYELPTKDLADGKASSSSYPSYYQMKAGGCWLMGRQAYMIGEDKTSISWMEESLLRYHKEPENEKTVDVKDILKYFAFSFYNQGNMGLAFNLTQQLIQLLPGGQTELISILESENKQRALTIKETANVNHDHDYKALCRGEKLMDSLTESKLHYSYTGPKEIPAFMILQPLKREQISLNPPVTVFYDFVSDQEIEILKAIAKPKLVPGSNTNSITGETQLNQRRVSLLAKLYDEEHALLLKISRRVQDVSGLALTNTMSSIFQYGIGGHFTPHWDYVLNETLRNEEGNVIATWITYLNDVESGGATVFTEAKLRIKPIKGSAVFWYNLFPNGRGNPRTRHAGCPVLSGSKWVLTKGFGLKKQEIRRPCRLNFDAEL